MQRRLALDTHSPFSPQTVASSPSTGARSRASNLRHKRAADSCRFLKLLELYIGHFGRSSPFRESRIEYCPKNARNLD
jgi:hypothetical protein